VNILVTGSSGQLATHLREVWPEATFLGRSDLDLSRPSAIEPAVLARRPTLIVNAAAYTAVDRAEQEPEVAWQVNAEAPAALARAAQTLEIPLLHVSTDYVFDGQSPTPYREHDPVAPLNVYGRSKLAGELAVASLCERYWILRASWVFSEHGSNFVKTVLRLARERESLAVVDDQFGRPTHAGSLATLIGRIVAGLDVPGSLPWGLYHAGAGPVVTWHRFAELIVERAAALGAIPAPKPVQAVSTADYDARSGRKAATRPRRAVLEPSVHQDVFVAQRDWRLGLETVMANARGAPGVSALR
jgi:dTDP-4-dehydrorhamnose reductase